VPKTTKKKSFDCVEFKHQAQRKIIEEVAGKTIPEQVAYFRRKAARGPLAGWWSAIDSGSVGSGRGRASA